MDYFKQHRKSYMEVGEIFFFTSTINNWKPLLKNDSYKQIIIDSLEWLANAGKLDVFAFVIMPNHFHVIWRTNDINGKETVQGSFLKYTAHQFRRKLLNDNPSSLAEYAVRASNKEYEFWQRDPVAIYLYSPPVAWQKLEYIHLNPLGEHWNLVTDPCEYYYSSASFYEKDIVHFPFLKDLRNEF
ncbi:transposase [Lacibacter sp.]|uniref:transposase n=1 Tax=Lacibacter sp. TaxID=1915409 RepID=UPI002B4AB4C0|nr:transposase [Lacibacter sp.]HLP39180.1 hypothetical protein [Lacibacter sp.]